MSRELAERLRGGDRRALAQAITLVESANPDHRAAKIELLDHVTSNGSNPAIRLGVSGTPGVGKSTLIEAMGMALITGGHRVAVLAVDPSSERTGGSILGDKTRMPGLATSPRAYVRPSAARGGLGGITSTTAAAITLCEAAGFDIVIVETVGVGQSETAVAGVTDLFLLLHSPGGGDELQGIKRGVMELADIVAVTKADGELLAPAKRAQAELRSALHLMRPKPGRDMTQVELVSAVSGDNLSGLIAAIIGLYRVLDSSGELTSLRSSQAVDQYQAAITAAIRDDRVDSGWDRDGTNRSPLAAALDATIGPNSSRPTELNAVTLATTDLAESVAFYTAVGLRVEFESEEFVTLSHGENFVNLQKAGAAASVGWGRFILFVPDPDAVYARAVTAGYTPHAAPTDAPWGERYFHIRDPQGHEVSFSRRL